MNTYSFTASAAQIQKIQTSFANVPSTKGNYILCQYHLSDCVITVYTSHKVVLQGKDADYYYQMLNPQPVKSFVEQAGSDEVGTGDFFGPICVCASVIDEQCYSFLKELKLDDSKKLNDDYICSTVEKIIDKVPHSLLVLDNEHYNHVISDNNMNQIKAKMHNKAYVNLIKKTGHPLPSLVVIDDFCGENKYYQYIQDEPEIIRGITFQTKAESSYLSVAVSSMISRYAFLKSMASLSEQYGMEFVKGAGTPADEFAQRFVEKHGKDALRFVAKMNFKNMQKL